MLPEVKLNTLPLLAANTVPLNVPSISVEELTVMEDVKGVGVVVGV